MKSRQQAVRIGDMLEIKNISKRYRKGSEVFTALDDVSFTMEKGEYVVVSGPSGAGKSTLLYTIAGMVTPDSGMLFYKGENIHEQGNGYLNKLRKKELGFMFQQFHLMPYLNVNDNIMMACSKRDQQKRIEYYLEKCSLKDLKKKYPSELSVGEKQRTAFIRAIINDPVLLLADEPTGNLDPVNSEMLMSLVKDYHLDGGTVIIVSHDPLLAGFAGRNLILQSGTLISDKVKGS